MLNMTPVLVSAGLGAADGFLARRDATDPARQSATSKQHSAWLEVAAVAGGLFLMSKAGNSRQEDTAKALTYTGGALLARRGGVYAAVQQNPAGVAGGGYLAAPHVLRPMLASPEFVVPPVQRSLSSALNSFV